MVEYEVEVTHLIPPPRLDMIGPVLGNTYRRSEHSETRTIYPSPAPQDITPEALRNKPSPKEVTVYQKADDTFVTVEETPGIPHDSTRDTQFDPFRLREAAQLTPAECVQKGIFIQITSDFVRQFLTPQNPFVPITTQEKPYNMYGYVTLRPRRRDTRETSSPQAPQGDKMLTPVS